MVPLIDILLSCSSVVVGQGKMKNDYNELTFSKIESFEGKGRLTL